MCVAENSPPVFVKMHSTRLILTPNQPTTIDFEATDTDDGLRYNVETNLGEAVYSISTRNLCAIMFTATIRFDLD